VSTSRGVTVCALFSALAWTQCTSDDSGMPGDSGTPDASPDARHQVDGASDAAPPDAFGDANVDGTADATVDARAGDAADAATTDAGAFERIVWKRLAAGPSGACGLLLDGTVECWGINACGLLGDGSMSSPILAPAPAVSGETFAALTFHTHACGLSSDPAIAGDIVCWDDSSSSTCPSWPTQQPPGVVP